MAQSLPAQSIRVLDPGVGFVDVSPETPVITGTSSLGTALALVSFSRPSDIRAAIGFGDGPDDVAKFLRERGGPVLFMKTAGTVAAVLSAVTKTGSGTPSPTVTGTPTMRTVTRVRVKVGGALGVAQFDYAHDNYQPLYVNPTWSQQRFIPAGGSYVFVNTGVTMTFPAGTYVAGDTFDFTTEPAHMNAADLAAAGAALQAINGASYKQWQIAGMFTTSTEGAAIAVALGGQLQSQAVAFSYARGVCDFGSADTAANAATAKASFQDVRVCPHYGAEITAAVLPFEGWGNRYGSGAASLGARAARVVASTDLARYAEGSLNGTQWLAHDSFLDNTANAAGLSTLRTWPKTPGFYVGAAYLAAAPGSDFQFWQYGRLMDLGCDAIFSAMLQFLADDLDVTASGTLAPLEAERVETAGSDSLRAKLMAPQNARGRPGLINNFSFDADLTNNIVQSSTLQTTVALQPRAYARYISQTIGFVASIAVPQ
jgi:hypothetical protein